MIGRYVQWLNADPGALAGPTLAREWWPAQEVPMGSPRVLEEQEVGRLTTYSRRRTGDVWGPPQVLNDAITLAAARTNNPPTLYYEKVVS